jgi:CheY-like chemotaxis protein
LHLINTLTNKHFKDFGTVNTSIHILVVDDRPDSVLFLTEFLLSRRHRVETCGNGTEALEAIVRRHRTENAYDLLISDVSMPGMDGITLLKEIRRRQMLLPVALYTAYGAMHPTLMQQAQQHDCMAVLDKPIDLRRVESLINDVIARRSGTRRHDQDQPFFGTSRVARTGTGTQRRETAQPDEHRPPSADSYALEPKPLPLIPSIEPLPHSPPPIPLPPPPIRTPLPFAASTEEPPQTHSMPSFRVKSPQASVQPGSTRVSVNPSFRTPLPFLQSNTADNTPPIAPVIPPMVASARLVRTPQFPIAQPIAPGSEETDSPPQPMTSRPTTAFIRRGVNQAPKDTNAIRRPSDHALPNDPVLPPQSPSTARIRRSVTGTYVPGPTTPAQPNPPTKRQIIGNQSSRAVACAHCHKVFMVATRAEVYTAVCVHCAQLNRIDPL